MGGRLHQGGDQHAKRLDDGSGRWEATVADLEDFTGRYFSDETETFFTREMENDTVVLRQRRMDEARRTPVWWIHVRVRVGSE